MLKTIILTKKHQKYIIILLQNIFIKNKKQKTKKFLK